MHKVTCLQFPYAGDLPTTEHTIDSLDMFRCRVKNDTKELYRFTAAYVTTKDMEDDRFGVLSLRRECTKSSFKPGVYFLLAEVKNKQYDKPVILASALLNTNGSFPWSISDIVVHDECAAKEDTVRKMANDYQHLFLQQSLLP